MADKRVRRRAVLAAAGWSVPVAAVGAPAAFAGTSLCEVEGSVQVGPLTDNVSFRAICTEQSQWLYPGTIRANYGVGRLPTFLEICGCAQQPQWYRWRETDTLSEFQIEVDGVHVDQNSSAAGWRTPFRLGFSDVGECKRFRLTYRTSEPRPFTNTNLQITFVLQAGPTSSGPWTQIETETVSGWIRRTYSGSVNFNYCSAGGSPNRVGTQALETAGEGD